MPNDGKPPTSFSMIEKLFLLSGRPIPNVTHHLTISEVATKRNLDQSHETAAAVFLSVVFGKLHTGLVYFLQG